MVNNRIVLGAVAFGVSFGISFLANRNANRALLTGLITLPATYAAAIVVDRRQKHRELLVLASQRQKIHELEAQEVNMNRILSNANLKKQELENSINYLQTECHQLRSQFEVRHQYKDDLEKELEILKTSLRELEQEKAALFAEKKVLEEDFTTKTRSKEALEQEISNLHQQKSTLLSQLESLNSQYNQIVEKIQKEQIKFTHQKSELEADLQSFKEQKRQIELKTYIIQNQVEKLERHKNDLQEKLKSLKTEKEEVRASLEALQLQKEQQQTELLALQEERNQLQSQILEFHQQIEALIAEPVSDNHQEDTEFPFLELIDSLETPDIEVDLSPELAPEWNEFMEQLPGYQIQILKVILEQNNPNQFIKEVAESKLTMPALLIDNINECAINTIGDRIINFDSKQVEIIEDYRENVKQVIQVYEGIMGS